MKLYTKRGDDGTTALFGGARVGKDTLRIECYGTVDELNSAIGVARAAGLTEDVDAALARVQEYSFVLGADLATPRDARPTVARIGESETRRLEQWIDAADALLPPLTAFILPGGSPGGAQLHLARTICRRAERHCVTLAAHEDVGPDVVRFLNRLSDLLFILARRENAAKGKSEQKWYG